MGLAYAYTVYKSQGQTLDRVLIDAQSHEFFEFFSHGMTYVACSRVRKGEDVRVLGNREEGIKNVVHHELLQQKRLDFNVKIAGNAKKDAPARGLVKIGKIKK